MAFNEMKGRFSNERRELEAMNKESPERFAQGFL
jgi:hypothetical protein